MPRYTLAVFDMDGTILDTLDDLHASLNAALTANGLPPRTREETRRFVGNGAKKLVERAAPAGTPPEVLARVGDSFAAHYRDHCADRTRPYPGIPALLRRLRDRGIRTAVVSNKPDYGVRALVDLHFPGLFDAAVGVGPDTAVKPAPDMVLRVLSALEVPPGEAVYIGDSDVDIGTARSAGLAGISVTWGFRDRAFLLSHGADTLADSPEALDALL